MGRRRSPVKRLVVAAFLALAATPVAAQDLRLPVLVPLTGFVALEGTSQRNGALLAAGETRDPAMKPDVLDTQSTPEAAVTAWQRAVGDPPPLAVVEDPLLQAPSTTAAPTSNMGKR